MCFLGPNCSENYGFRQKKTKMHDREASRTYLDCTAELKYLSAVGPSEIELLFNRKGLRPKLEKHHAGLVFSLRSSFF